MLIEGQEFNAKLGAPTLTVEDVFRFCQFDDLDVDGVSFAGMMEGCTFTRATFYWGFFNTTALIDVRFVDCVFPGTSFRGCRLVECAFVNCRFVLDNLGGSATIDECSFTECRFEGCSFERSPRDTGDVVTASNRFYGCQISGCDGLAPR